MERPSEPLAAAGDRVSSAPNSPVPGWADLAGQARAWRSELLLGLIVVFAVSVPLTLSLGLAAAYLATGTLLFVVLGFSVLLTSPPSFRTEGPGLANRVTFLRATLVVPVAALVFHPAQQGPVAILAVMAVAVLALLLDGVDGAVARRSGRVTAFGARFDMELDALLILVLAILVWQTQRMGIWVLLIGLMRYGFVAAGWHWRWLQAALPPSRRRQALCVVQSVALLIALAPPVPPAGAIAAALGALLLLAYSFTVDVLWLHRHRHTAPVEAG